MRALPRGIVCAWIACHAALAHAQPAPSARDAPGQAHKGHSGNPRDAKAVGSAAAPGTDPAAPDPEAASDPLEQFRRAQDKLREANDALREAQARLKAAANGAEGQARAEFSAARDQALQTMQAAQREMREVAKAMHAHGEAARQRVDAELDNVRTLTQAQRRALAQSKVWQALRERFGGDRALSPPLRTELQLHAQRLAKLTRIRQLALQANDTEALKRVQALHERENARHARWLDALDAAPSPAPPKEKAP